MRVDCKGMAVTKIAEQILQELRIPYKKQSLQQQDVHLLIITSLEPNQELQLREAIRKLPGVTIR